MARKERGPSRTKQRAAQLEAASRIRIPTKADVCVVGGGAAGLVAGIVAAEQGARVVVFEQDLACGRPILATGNGRCNFANTQLDPHLYNDPSFVGNVCGAQWLSDVLKFFQQSGLAWAEEAEGRLYPLSRQAASVQSVLLQRAQRAGVMLATAREVTHVLNNPPGFSVTIRKQWNEEEERTLTAKTVILATGGTHALPIQKLNLRCASLTPLLCPLACVPATSRTGNAVPLGNMPKEQHPFGTLSLTQLDGRRVRAAVKLLRNQQTVATEHGEVLFRPYGISGIAVFNLSRHAQPGDTLAIDLLPSLTLEQAYALGSNTLDGLLDPAIAHVLEASAPTKAEALALAKSLELHVEGLADTSHAQVHRGGLLCDQFDPQTLGCTHIHGLFACGEALNVDGPCGGYNLAWAWKSGMVAGSAAAKEALQ